MKPLFQIEKNNSSYKLQMFDENEHFILESKAFKDYKSCLEFLDRLRIHMCFQTNFSRCKNEHVFTVIYEHLFVSFVRLLVVSIVYMR